MTAELLNRRVVVTGAGSGIGRATALCFAAAGARVLAADLDHAAALETVAAGEGELQATQVDVSDEESVEAMFALGDRLWDGRLDVLANIAGVGSTTNVLGTSLESWRAVFSVNATGTFLCSKAAVRRMVSNGGGAIINMASVAALVGVPNRAAYCAAKGAVVALTRALAIDHVRDGIRVNAVCPGTVDSPWVTRLTGDAGESREELMARQPMGRLGTPDEVAAAVVYLASDAAAFVTGAQLVIDGGLTAA